MQNAHAHINTVYVIIRCKKFFVHLIFVGGVAHKKNFNNENFPIYGILFLCVLNLLIWHTHGTAAYYVIACNGINAF